MILLLCLPKQLKFIANWLWLYYIQPNLTLRSREKYMNMMLKRSLFRVQCRSEYSWRHMEEKKRDDDWNFCIQLTETRMGEGKSVWNRGDTKHNWGFGVYDRLLKRPCTTHTSFHILCRRGCMLSKSGGGVLCTWAHALTIYVWIHPMFQKNNGSSTFPAKQIWH